MAVALGAVGCVIEPNRAVETIDVACSPPSQLGQFQAVCQGSCGNSAWHLSGLCGLSQWVSITCTCDDGATFNMTLDGNRVAATPLDGNSTSAKE